MEETNLRKLLADKLGPKSEAEDTLLSREEMAEEIAGLELRVSRLNEELADAQRAEAELRAELQAHRGVLSGLRESEIERQTKNEAELVSTFRLLLPKLGELDVSMSAMSECIKQRAGTCEASAKVRELLSNVLSGWDEEMTEIPVNIKKWGCEEFDARMKGIAKHPEVLAKLSQVESSNWYRAQSLRQEMTRLYEDAEASVQAAVAATKAAQAVLAVADPKSVYAAILSAYYAREIANNQEGRIQQTWYDLEGYISRTEFAAQAAQGQQEQARGELTAVDYATRAPVTPSGALVAQGDGRNWEHDDQMPWSVFPAVNPASGLPMSGGNSHLDVAGNVFGTSNTFD